MGFMLIVAILNDIATAAVLTLAVVALGVAAWGIGVIIADLRR